jgi:hypothetical protein
VLGIFEIEAQELFAQAGLRKVILLVSASWVARDYRCEALAPGFIVNLRAQWILILYRMFGLQILLSVWGFSHPSSSLCTERVVRSILSFLCLGRHLQCQGQEPPGLGSQQSSAVFSVCAFTTWWLLSMSFMPG